MELTAWNPLLCQMLRFQGYQEGSKGGREDRKGEGREESKGGACMQSGLAPLPGAGQGRCAPLPGAVQLKGVLLLFPWSWTGTLCISCQASKCL